MDNLTSEERSAVMGLVKSRNTKPEIKVRKALYALGFRYRLHAKDLPGSPDIVFRKYKTVVFVHGCFWHRHPKCKKKRVPKSNIKFWIDKFEENVARDRKILLQYKELGWNVVIVWECETEKADLLERALSRVSDKLV